MLLLHSSVGFYGDFDSRPYSSCTKHLGVRLIWLFYVLDFLASGVSNAEKIKSNTSCAYIHDYTVEYC
jgi:hypothetical protein